MLSVMLVLLQLQNYFCFHWMMMVDCIIKQDTKRTCYIFLLCLQTLIGVIKTLTLDWLLNQILLTHRH